MTRADQSEALARCLSAMLAILQTEFPGTVCQIIAVETPSGAPERGSFQAGPEDVVMVTTGMDSNEEGLLRLALERVAEAARQIVAHRDDYTANAADVPLVDALDALDALAPDGGKS